MMAARSIGKGLGDGGGLARLAAVLAAVLVLVVFSTEPRAEEAELPAAESEDSLAFPDESLPEIMRAGPKKRRAKQKRNRRKGAGKDKPQKNTKQKVCQPTFPVK